MNRFIRSIAIAAGSAGSLWISSSTAQAQEFPSKQVTIIAPSTPGGGIDFLARVYAAELSKRWKQPAVVENKPGASGLLGLQLTARAQADGYTLPEAAVACSAP